MRRRRRGYTGTKRAQMPQRRWGERIIHISQIDWWLCRATAALIIFAAIYFTAQLVAGVAAGRIPLVVGGAP